MTADRSLAPAWLPHLAGGAAYTTAVAWFARNQELWTDEVTQLSGLRLNPIEAVKWLAGADRQRFGVPGDRMPPLSYWAGWLWSHAFGLSERSLRAMAAVAVGIALLLMIETARQCFGVRSAWVVALTCGLGPNWLTFGAEIRTYPLLMLGSAAAFFALAQLTRVSAVLAPRYWGLLAAACLCAAYAHFFGLVLSGAAFCAAIWILYQRQLPWRVPVALTGAFALCSLGLVPFVRSAFEMSRSPGSGAGASSVHLHFPLNPTLRLGYRMLGGHPAHSFSALPGALVAGAALACVVLGLLYRGRSLLQVCLSVCVLLGIAADVLVGMVARGFNPFTASYNVWLLPPLALLIAACVADDRSGNWLAAGRVAAVATVFGVLLGAGNLLLHPKVYVHGPSARVSTRVHELARADLSGVVLIHDAEEAWGHSYFPLLYEFGTNLSQVLLERDPKTQALQLTQLPEQTPLDWAALSSKRLLFMTTKNEGAVELGRYVRSGQPPALGDEQLRLALASRGCEMSDTQAYMALISAELSTLQCR